MCETVYPSWPRGAARVLGAVLAPFVFRGAHASFRSDVLVEAEAEMAVDARDILADISVPVLLIGGGEDQFFTRAVIEETARLIPDCTLQIYEGKDHLAAVSDERLPKDVFDFVARGPRHPTGAASLRAGRRDGLSDRLHDLRLLNPVVAMWRHTR